MIYSLKNQYKHLLKEDTDSSGVAQVTFPDDDNIVRMYDVTASNDKKTIKGDEIQVITISGVTGINSKLDAKLMPNTVKKDESSIEKKVKAYYENIIIDDIRKLFISSYVNRNNIIFDIMKANSVDNDDENINAAFQTLGALSKRFSSIMKETVGIEGDDKTIQITGINATAKSGSKFAHPNALVFNAAGLKAFTDNPTLTPDTAKANQTKRMTSDFQSWVNEILKSDFLNDLQNNRYIERCLSRSDFTHLNDVINLIKSSSNEIYLWYDKELGTLYFDDKDDDTNLTSQQKITCSRYLYIISVLAMMRNLATDNEYNSIEKVFDQASNEVDKNALAINIMKQYSSESNVSKLFKAINVDNFEIRKKCNNINEVITTLNQNQSFFKDYGPAERIGRGEFACHLLFQTSNCFLSIEPDAIITTEEGDKKCSVKSFMKDSGSGLGSAQTGTNMSTNIRNSYIKFLKKLNLKETVCVNDSIIKQLPSDFFDFIAYLLGFNDFDNKNVTNLKSKAKGKQFNLKSILNAKASISTKMTSSDKIEYLKLLFKEDIYSNIDDSIDDNDKLNEIIKNYKNKTNVTVLKRELDQVKKAIVSEHDAEFVICFNNSQGAYLFNNGTDNASRIAIKNVTESRTSFNISHTNFNQDCKFKKGIEKIESALNAQTQQNSSYKRKGGLLKEVYSHLFKKKVITEGGKAGHMMHPYENLHMKISDMKRMIEDFQNDFEISEKVDGANLFFTVNPSTGQVLFSRNKADMSYQETLDKFGPDHPAHILFNEGAKSIFNAIQRSLNMEEVKQIFGQQLEGGKTYINFEIMHPQKPNQIKYDMKWIVFHAIVDFDINDEKVLSSSDDPRLLSLIEKLQPYFNVYDNDFNLGSNFKIKLNSLSPEDVEELLVELESITRKIGISDEMTIADAVKHEIVSLLDRENLSNRLSSDKIDLIYNFITDENSSIKGTEIKKGLDKEVQKTLTDLGLTSKTKAYKIIKKVISDFKPLFILLGIKLLHNVQSRYMSSEASEKNVGELRRLLIAAIEDYNEMLSQENLSERETQIVNSLESHVEDVNYYGIDYVVSSPVEGGVFIGHDGNTYKVTGGFAPLNQILGTAMRNLDSMPKFKQEFLSQERGN